jgi:hypothetical protein
MTFLFLYGVNECSRANHSNCFGWPRHIQNSKHHGPMVPPDHHFHHHEFLFLKKPAVAWMVTWLTQGDGTGHGRLTSDDDGAVVGGAAQRTSVGSRHMQARRPRPGGVRTCVARVARAAGGGRDAACASCSPARSASPVQLCISARASATTTELRRGQTRMNLYLLFDHWFYGHHPSLLFFFLFYHASPPDLYIYRQQYSCVSELLP